MESSQSMLTGTGTLVLNGGGIYIANADSESAVVLTVAPGITLTGTGEISSAFWTATVVNQGTIAPDGTIYIDGNYVQEHSGTIDIRIWGNTEYDRLVNRNKAGKGAGPTTSPPLGANVAAEKYRASIV